MPKRSFTKFREREGSAHILDDGALRAQRKQLERLLEHGKKNLFRALKLARGFERQKLGRRQKTVKKGSGAPEMVRLPAEVAALKSLHLPSTAELHLYKSILKSKRILSAPALPSYISAKVAAAQSQDTTLLNVQARLFNSNPVKVAMADTMNSIRATLGIENRVSEGNKKRLRAADYSSNDIHASKAAETQARPAKSLANNEHDDPDGQGRPALSNHMEEIGAPGGENEYSGSQESENESLDMTAYIARLAESSDDDATEEDLLQNPSAKERKLRYSPSKGLSPSPSSSPSVCSASSIPVHSNPRKSSSAAIKSPIFLPSLTMGGYISGSDPDISASSSNRGRTATKPRKNRRGQQERRQIWEKKFGKNANHLKKSQHESQNRDQGWDPRKGARADDGRGKRGSGRGRGRAGDSRKGPSRPSRGPTISGANSDPVQARKNTNEKGGKGNQAEQPLHPSWEAAKKAKEAKKNATFQGKKITFD